MEQARADQGDGVGFSILDRRRAGADAAARRQIDAAVPPPEEQASNAVDNAILARGVPDDVMKVRFLRASNGDLDVAKAAFAMLAPGDDRVPARALPDDALLADLFEIANGNLDAFQALGEWVLGHPIG